jgi:hypothetical protein
VYEGRMTVQVKDRFSDLVGRSFVEFVRTKINDRLKSALESGASNAPTDTDSKDAKTFIDDDGIETTVEEIESHMIIRAICAEVVDPSKITMRDAKSYCAVLFDDNNRRPLARLYYTKRKMSIGVFFGKDEVKYDIDNLTDIYKHRTEILNSVKQYI